MKAYLAITSLLFALLTAVHIWRMVVERSVTRDPFFLAITIIAASLCIWGLRLLKQTRA